MFQVLIEKSLLTISIISLLLLSIICQIIIGVIYQRLLRETENLSTTENKQLKQCKLKFQHCYQLNGKIPNIDVFVDKFISRLAVGSITLNMLKVIASQLVLLSVFLAGLGACIAIIEGEILFRILPYYLLALVGLYIYFAVAAVVDLQGRKEVLKINLIDYLENHLVSRMQNNALETGKMHQDGEVAASGEAAKNRKAVASGGEVRSREAAGSGGADKPKAAPEKTSPQIGQTEKGEHSILKNFAREKELKAAIAAFTEDEIEEMLKELIV